MTDLYPHEYLLKVWKENRWLLIPLFVTLVIAYIVLFIISAIFLPPVTDLCGTMYPVDTYQYSNLNPMPIVILIITSAVAFYTWRLL